MRQGSRQGRACESGLRQCAKHKEGEAKAVPEKSDAGKPAEKPAEEVKADTHPG